MDELLKDRLKADFKTFTFEVFDKSTGGAAINLSYRWAQTSPEIKEILVYLSGRDYISGQDISQRTEPVRFSHTVSSGTIRTTSSGNFYLCFDARTHGGELIRDFQPKQAISITSGTVPYIRYRVKAELSGWSSLTVETNCAPGCLDGLWLKVGSSLQRISIQSSTLNLYVPASPDKISLRSFDPLLPKAERS